MELLSAVLTSNSPAGGVLTFVIPVGIFAAAVLFGFFSRKRLS